jgi:hypothetical protein
MNSRKRVDTKDRGAPTYSLPRFRKKTLRLVKRCCEDIEAGRPLDERLRCEAIVNYRYDLAPSWFKEAMKKGTAAHQLISNVNRDPAWINAATTVLGCLLTDVINIKSAGDAGQRVLAILALWLGDEWLQRVAEEGTWMPDVRPSNPQQGARSSGHRRVRRQTKKAAEAAS